MSKRFGDMTADEKRVAVARAAQQLETELNANAEGIAKALDETVDVQRYVDRAIMQIDDDMASGRVPLDVADFSRLHDFVDANDYGQAEGDEVPWDDASDEPWRWMNQVQSAIDDLLVQRSYVDGAPTLREVADAIRDGKLPTDERKIVVSVVLTFPISAAKGYVPDRFYPTWQDSLAETVKATLREVANDHGDVNVPQSITVDVTTPTYD